MDNLEFARTMQRRTMTFSVEVIRFYSKLPRTDEARIPGKQFLRAGTAVGANYRAVCRAKSKGDFISKMGTVVEEVDESIFWLDLMESASVCTNSPLVTLRREANELLRLFSTALKTAKGRS